VLAHAGAGEEAGAQVLDLADVGEDVVAGVLGPGGADVERLAQG
jgi:hypothetical protein